MVWFGTYHPALKAHSLRLASQLWMDADPLPDMITVQEAAYEVFTKTSGACEKLCQPTLPALYEYGHSLFAKLGSFRCGNYAGSICEIIVLLPC